MGMDRACFIALLLLASISVTDSFFVPIPLPSILMLRGSEGSWNGESLRGSHKHMSFGRSCYHINSADKAIHWCREKESHTRALHLGKGSPTSKICLTSLRGAEDGGR